MRTAGPLTDLDLAAVRAFSGLVKTLGHAGPARRPAPTPARRYAMRLALWRLNNPQALDPELRGEIR